MIVQGKNKLDESYHLLRATIIQSTQLENTLNSKKKHIADLKSEQEHLIAAISEA